jgi:hypothetical protein
MVVVSILITMPMWMGRRTHRPSATHGAMFFSKISYCLRLYKEGGKWRDQNELIIKIESIKDQNITVPISLVYFVIFLMHIRNLAGTVSYMTCVGWYKKRRFTSSASQSLLNRYHRHSLC